MKRMFLASLLATTALAGFAADKAAAKPKKADCASCKECCSKTCPPEATKSDSPQK
ncbi:MAG TPA: hypothetical protein VJ483_00765 [Holophagaceae bacterium]|nr:hypothetical protein [Holophagaceae bacterium]